MNPRLGPCWYCKRYPSVGCRPYPECECTKCIPAGGPPIEIVYKNTQEHMDSVRQYGKPNTEVAAYPSFEGEEGFKESSDGARWYKRGGSMMKIIPGDEIFPWYKVNMRQGSSHTPIGYFRLCKDPILAEKLKRNPFKQIYYGGFFWYKGHDKATQEIRSRQNKLY